MLSFLLPLALAASPVSAPGEEPRDGITLAPDSEARWIAFDLTPSNQIRFEAVLNGRPVRAILDTGLTNTLATRDFATRARLALGRSQRALAIGGGVEVAWAPGGTLVMGGLTRRGGRIAVPDAPGQDRFGADLLIGSDILSCCALDIDYAARRFRILPTGRMPFTGQTASLALQRGSEVPVTEIRLGGARLRPMIVDTGDGAAITLSRPAWASANYRGATLTTTLGWGIGGALVSETAVIPGFILGGNILSETEVRIEGEGGYSASAGAAGRIGTGLLLRYRVLLDPRAGRMVLQPGLAPPPVLRSTSGLLLGAEGTHLRVLHVMRGSPAAETGWQEGDKICAADGAPVAGRPIEWSAGVPGRVVALELCDGTARRLTLRKFY
ncbi:aspartyl protease family protein [Sphingomonas sp. NIBR02145]|uniref:aspartyl protease family protein n=1 Tax=Sphingomonas sp. NIBR02145 TaxID=3014784 RepID=UPI0022B417C3|nr:aspartyl protease family protein [Sphingomonas sp. NIBR02145]WHU01089.1 aspartyl protease family protein [Sphingomonas sp. NIBR02145]